MQNGKTNTATVNALNLLRKEIGLRLIGPDLVLYRSRPTQEDWQRAKSGFPAKAVFKNLTGQVLSEEDYYYSGAQFTDREGHGWERITVHYDYGIKEVVLSYTGTNKATEAILSKYLMPFNGPSTNISGVMAAVKTAAAGWPDGPNYE
jgi:hypothetical protein